MSDEPKPEMYATKVRTIFNDGSCFEGNEVQTALVVGFTGIGRGGVYSSEVLEEIPVINYEDEP